MGLLRLLLALSVVLAHAGTFHGFDLVGGKAAVETFFMISGFYMALVLTEKYGQIEQLGRRLKTFYGARLLRLYPIYALAVVATLAVDATERHNWQHLIATGGGSFGPVGLVILIATNLLIIGQDAVIFLGSHPHGGLYIAPSLANNPHPLYGFQVVGQAWSLSLELGFYAIVPFLVRRSVWVIAALGCVSIASRVIVAHVAGLKLDPWEYRFFPTELIFFLAGVLAYRGYRRYRTQPLPQPAAALVLATVIAAMIAFNYVTTYGKAVVFYGLVAISLPVIFNLTKRSAADRFIGDLSYPVYMLHEAVGIYLVLHYGQRPIAEVLIILAIAPLVLVTIDRPIDKFRQRRVQAASAAAAAVVTSPGWEPNPL
jgi:peptidoglycan/LPS O-acetylase OafA/YrhL